MNLTPESIVVVGMLTASLIDHECLLSLAVVAVRDKIRARTESIGVRHKSQQLAAGDIRIGQCRAVVVPCLLIGGVTVGCRQCFDLSVGGIGGPCRAVLIGSTPAGDVVFNLRDLPTGSIVFKPGFHVLRIECRKHLAVIVVAGGADEDRVGACGDRRRTGKRRSAVGAVVRRGKLSSDSVDP